MSQIITDTTTWTLCAGANRNQRRLWIEGRRLADAGWIRGTRFGRTVTDDYIVLAACTEESFAEFGARSRGTVSGKGSKPVIDLNGKWLTTFLGGSVDHHGRASGDYAAGVAGTCQRVKITAGSVYGKKVIVIQRDE